MRIVVTSGVAFDPTLGTLDFTVAAATGALGAGGFDVRRVMGVINETNPAVLYAAASTTSTLFSVSGSVMTLTTSTAGMRSDDNLTVVYDLPSGSALSIASHPVVIASDQSNVRMAGYDATYNKQIIGSARDTFRDGFSGSTLDATKWTMNQDASDVVGLGGNAGGSSYLCITKSPLTASNSTVVQSVASFMLPARIMYGVTLSQRIMAQEFAVEIVGVDGTTLAVQSLASDSTLPLSVNSISKAAATMTLTFTGTHNLIVGDRVVIAGCMDNRFNHSGITVSSIVSTTSVVVTSALAFPFTYNTSNGYLLRTDPCGYAVNASTLLMDNTTSLSDTYVVRSGGDSFLAATATFGNTAATVPAALNTAFTYGFQPTNKFENMVSCDCVTFMASPVDSLAAAPVVVKRSQVIPDMAQKYKLRIRANNLATMPVPCGRITSAVKSGSTLATITTDGNHGLTASSWVTIVGIRDFTNFAAQVVPVAVVSIVATNSFTVNFGISATASSYGGGVFLGSGNQAAGNSAITMSVQSITVASGQITLVGGAAWAGITYGENVALYGLPSAQVAYEGTYLVGNVSTTTLTLIAPNASPLGTTNVGGAVIKATDFRIHYVHVSDFGHHAVEVVAGVNRNDINYSVPVAVNNTPAVTITSGTVTQLTTTPNALHVAAIAPVTTTLADDILMQTGASQDGTAGNSNKCRVAASMAIDRPGTLLLDQSTDTFTFVETGKTVLTSTPSVNTRIVAASRAATVGTYTTVTPHSLVLGQAITTSNLVPTSFNVFGTVASVPSATTFTLANDVSATVGAATIPLSNATRAANLNTYQLKTVTVTNVARTTQVATITTTLPHNYAVSDTVTITGCTPTTFNGTYTILTVPLITTFTCYQNTSDFTSAASSGFVAQAHTLTAGAVVTTTGYTTASFNVSNAIVSSTSNGSISIYSANGSESSAVGTGTLQAFGAACPNTTLYSGTVVTPVVARYCRYRYLADPTVVVKRADVVSTSRINNIATLVTAVAHAFVVGDCIVVTSSPSFNGTYVVNAINVNATTSVSFVMVGTLSPSALSPGVITSTSSRVWSAVSFLSA